MTAAELIALLREHPGCCGVLGIRIESKPNAAYTTDLVVTCYGSIYQATCFRRWLTGAAVEKCDELGIIVGPSTENGVRVWHNGTGNGHPTRLHASLAGLEAHKEHT